MTTQSEMNPLAKIALELGPLMVFFAANARWGIFGGTAAFMLAVLLSIAGSYILTRRVPLMALISAIVVLVFGGLTLLLHDALFIKLKPTIIYTLFGTILLGGLALGKPLLAAVFDRMLNLTETGWRKLTWRWGLFFLAMALLNELVWRTQTTDFWVSFKVFAVLPLTFVFGALQFRLLSRYEPRAEASGQASE
jgi:intracellular septation protein